MSHHNKLIQYSYNSYQLTWNSVQETANLTTDYPHLLFRTNQLNLNTCYSETSLWSLLNYFVLVLSELKRVIPEIYYFLNVLKMFCLDNILQWACTAMYHFVSHFSPHPHKLNDCESIIYLLKGSVVDTLPAPVDTVMVEM